MAIQLDHVIVPSRQRLASAKLLAELLGVPWEESRGEFTPVYVNDSLTVDFADREQFQRYHLCFRVTDTDFDAIFGRIQSAGLATPPARLEGTGPPDPPATSGRPPFPVRANLRSHSGHQWRVSARRCLRVEPSYPPIVSRAGPCRPSPPRRNHPQWILSSQR